MSEAKRWMSGNLEFFSETGTEGGYWAIQVDGYWHGPDFDCGQAGCPLNYREVEGSDGTMSPTGTGRRMTEHHYSYEGLYTLRSKDKLQLLDETDEPAGEKLTLKLLHQKDQYARGAYAAGGALVSHNLPAEGVEPSVWESWFFDGRRARVKSADDRLPKPVMDLTQVFPGGHYVAK